MKNQLTEQVDYQVRRTRLGTWRRFLYPSGHLYSEFTSHADLLGLPLLHYTSGVCPETGRRRTARGVIAVGARALGLLALGRVALGAVALGQASLGLSGWGRSPPASSVAGLTCSCASPGSAGIFLRWRERPQPVGRTLDPK
jgi:hypothetical protein